MSNYLHSIRVRILFIVSITVMTVILGYHATRLRVVIDPMAVLPASHAFVSSKTLLEQEFKQHYSLVVAITSKAGIPADKAVLQKIGRITEAFKNDPGVIKSSILSVASQNAKVIQSSDGDTFKVLALKTVINDTPKLLSWLDDNPAYSNTLVSEDQKTFTVIAQFKSDDQGYASILNRIEPAIDNEKDDAVDIYTSGEIYFLAELERYSERIFLLLPASILLIAILLYMAFRSWQGFILPLLTANIALIWVLGIMGASGIKLDVFNVTTPILILAIAAGHAVQMLKRYYEEYQTLNTHSKLSASEANLQAVMISVKRVGRYMIAASLVAALGFLSLTLFEIKTIKIFGLFTGIGVLSALLIELTFMPALRSLLQPPAKSGHRSGETRDIWSAIIGFCIRHCGSRRMLWSWLLISVLAITGTWQVNIENSNKANFAEWTPIRQADDYINQHLGGTQTFYVMLDTGQPDGIKQPATLQAIADLQQSLSSIPGVGKTLSIADFIRRMQGAMQNNATPSLPDSQDLISQYLLLYSMSGDGNDFESYVDFDYRRANLKIYVKQDDSAFVRNLVEQTQIKAQQLLPPNIKLSFGGGVAEAQALNEVLVHEKLLNILQIMLVVLIAASLLFRSWLAGCLVLLPLLMTVLCNFGMLGWFGIPLDISTSMISAMAVGIGADYAIYLISRYREQYRHHPSTALTVTLQTAGKACLFVASAIALGYGVLAFSFGFRAHQWLALLIATAMLVSVMASLTLIPAILDRYRPAFLNHR